VRNVNFRRRVLLSKLTENGICQRPHVISSRFSWNNANTKIAK